uniref:Transcription termination factor 3, mitochondrial n=2 Tax=Canis lupus TaxID=9612 RepID=A0A8C0P9U7_CANLF
MHLVVHVVFAQGPAPHARRHGAPPRPAAALAALAAAPGPGGRDPGAGGRTAGGRRGRDWRRAGAGGREGRAREGGVGAPPTRPRAGGAAGRAPAAAPPAASPAPRRGRPNAGAGRRGAASGAGAAAGAGRLLPPRAARPPPRGLADGLAHSGRSARGRGLGGAAGRGLGGAGPRGAGPGTLARPGAGPPQATLRKMALSARQIPRWFNSVKLSSFVTAMQLGKRFPRAGKTLLHGVSAQPQMSSGNCFLQWGFKAYRTSSLRNSSQSANPSRQEIGSAQSTLLPSVNEQTPKTQKIPSLDSELPLEALDDLPSLAPLQPVSEEEAIQIIADPPLPPDTFTLRDYVDHSETLQKLVHLGVDLSKIEKHPEAANLLLRLDFEKDIKQILMFLKDLGIEDNQLGPYLTKNYAIFSEDLENLKTRVAYLQSKNFSKAQIAQMVRNAPFLLSFSVERLDNRLGFFQKELELSVKKTRDLVVRLPRLLTGSLEPVKENMKVYRLELGFKHNEIQHMITRVPKMLTANKRKLTETFDYVHNVMNIPHHLIVRFPQVFNTRLFKVKERHLFLTYLGRAQYDPTKPNYISLDKFVSVPDEIFCEEIAKASVQDFEKFLKTL